MATFGYSSSNYRSSDDWKMDDLRGKLQRCQELINNLNVNEDKLKREMQKVMMENKKLKAEVEKIHSRFKIFYYIYASIKCFDCSFRLIFRVFPCF